MWLDILCFQCITFFLTCVLPCNEFWSNDPLKNRPWLICHCKMQLYRWIWIGVLLEDQMWLIYSIGMLLVTSHHHLLHWIVAWRLFGLLQLEEFLLLSLIFLLLYQLFLVQVLLHVTKIIYQSIIQVFCVTNYEFVEASQ